MPIHPNCAPSPMHPHPSPLRPLTIPLILITIILLINRLGLRLIPRAREDILLPRLRRILEQCLSRVLVAHITPVNVLHDVLLIRCALGERGGGGYVWAPRV